MVLHYSNFEIPARFSFYPFFATWRFARAETEEWVEKPRLRMAFSEAGDDPERTWLRVRIEVPDDAEELTALGLGVGSSYEVLMDRVCIPPDVLQKNENHRNTPDVAGRNFTVLICQKPEFQDGPWALEPGKVAKNARIMRDEFLGLEADPEFGPIGWDWSVRRFLNKWGLWCSEKGYVEAWDFSFPAIAALHESVSKQKINKPGFVMVNPHLLKAQQERYGKARLPKNARNWLSLHPLSLDTDGEFPFFRLRKNYCRDAIEATITIDHLAGIKHGLCKRCHKSFAKETRHKKNYCSERCFNAAGVQRWREKQRKAAKKGAKRNAKG